MVKDAVCCFYMYIGYVNVRTCTCIHMCIGIKALFFSIMCGKDHQHTRYICIHAHIYTLKIGIGTGNKLNYQCAQQCVFVPLLYYMNGGCVLEYRDAPTSQVTI